MTSNCPHCRRVAWALEQERSNPPPTCEECRMVHPSDDGQCPTFVRPITVPAINRPINPYYVQTVQITLEVL